MNAAPSAQSPWLVSKIGRGLAPCPPADPAFLITTGDHDDRVVPLHSHKLTATLQHVLAGEAGGGVLGWPAGWLLPWATCVCSVSWVLSAFLVLHA